MKTNHPLGFSTGFYYKSFKDWPFLKQARLYKSLGCEAIELAFMRDYYFEQDFDEEFYELIKSFTYRSIHMPRMLLPEDLEKYHKKIIKIANQIEAHTLVAHPGEISDFPEFANRFDGCCANLAFENMDSRNAYGKTTEDLLKVFEMVPNAKWVFDLNHIYSNDRTMNMADNMYDKLKDRLAHYHLSGFGNEETLHDCLYQTKEDIIFSKLYNDSAPIILESVDNNSADIHKELNYVKTHIL